MTVSQPFFYFLDSLDVLIESLNKKRTTMPINQYAEDDLGNSTTEDEASTLQMQKSNKKEEVGLWFL